MPSHAGGPSHVRASEATLGSSSHAPRSPARRTHDTSVGFHAPRHSHPQRYAPAAGDCHCAAGVRGRGHLGSAAPADGPARPDDLHRRPALADDAPCASAMAGHSAPRAVPGVHCDGQRVGRSERHVAAQRPRGPRRCARSGEWRPRRHARGGRRPRADVRPSWAAGPRRRRAPVRVRGRDGCAGSWLRQPPRRAQPRAVERSASPSEPARISAGEGARGRRIRRQPARPRGTDAGHPEPGDGCPRGDVRLSLPVGLPLGRRDASPRRAAQLPVPDRGDRAERGNRRPNRPHPRVGLPAGCPTATQRSCPRIPTC